MRDFIINKGFNHRITVFFFIIMIGCVALAQIIKEIYYNEPLYEFDIFKQLPTVENLRLYENKLEDNSIVARYIRPWHQWVLTLLVKRGNSKVIVGRDGWLFYRPGIDYIIKPDSAYDREFGPLQAIIAFHESLRSHGIELILLPVPDKATIYPEYISKRYIRQSVPPVNVYSHEFFNNLKARGITVLDLTEVFWKEKQYKTLYIKQDTHWSPEGMKIAARLLAEKIKEKEWLNEIQCRSFISQPVEVERFGDLYDMLNLPKSVNNFAPIKVMVEKVIDKKTGKPCAPDPSSPIVLLGDSFVNIYSKKDMGWGESAGFSEHLALNLKIPIDVIAINDGGATKSRQSFARRHNALAGKKLVIWQFAVRDLTNPESKWEIVKISPPRIETIQPKKMQKQVKIEEQNEITAIEEKTDEKPQDAEKPEEQRLTVIGEVLIVSSVPDPSKVVYTECLTYIKYRVIKVEHGSYDKPELIAVFWGMKDSKLMPPANFKAGEKHRLVLDNLDKYEELLHVMQADDTGDYENTPFWVLEMTKQ
ncbi:MAG: alginate O-acetyltransferase AlgX-related protein [bacterium]